jgi:tRNA(Ile)-lysidine synthase
MRKKLREILYSRIGIKPESRIILAVSGGIDSMVMLYLFKELDHDLLVAHCNFKLRGEESDMDESFLKQQCEQMAIPFISRSFNTEEYAEEKSISLQMAARDLRYNWFQELITEKKFDFLATAHNLNDQIETFFINLSRGTGIKGLTGIPVKKGILLRPLIQFGREEISGFAEDNNVEWREDASNIKTYYKRNKIRHELIPVLMKLNPSFVKTMQENFQILSEVESIYLDFVKSRTEDLLQKKSDFIRIPIQGLLNEKYGLSVLYEILSPLNFSTTDINNIWNKLDTATPGKKFLSGTHRLIKDREFLLIEDLKNDERKLFYIEQYQSEIFQPVHLLLKYLENKQDFSPFAKSNIAYLDADRLDFPLLLRKWHPGDYFYPFGMNNSKKLSDYFVDNKFSIPMKENTWILCSHEEIVWIIGHRIDNRFRVKNSTKRILRIECLNKA